SDAVTLASELPPIVAQMEETRLNRRSVAQALRWGMNDGCRETLLEGVYRVSPGCWIELDPASLEVSPEQRYFDFDTIRQQEWDFDEARDTLRDTFLTSVERHMRSDAPLGFALSGGIDSSAIVCAAHALGRSDIATFSYALLDERISERKWIDIVAGHVGATTHFIRPSHQDAATNLPDVVRFQGEPFASLSIYAQYEVYAEVARRG